MDKKVIQYSVTKLHKLNLNSTRDISVTSDTSDTCFPLFFIFNIFFDKHIFFFQNFCCNRIFGVKSVKSVKRAKDDGDMQALLPW